MKIKRYLTSSEINQYGVDFCEMFYNKDAGGYYDATYIDTPEQLSLLQQIEKTEATILQYTNIIADLKNQLQQLKEQYHNLDN